MMKISDVIKNLEYAKGTYGDVQVRIVNNGIKERELIYTEEVRPGGTLLILAADVKRPYLTDESVALISHLTSIHDCKNCPLEDTCGDGPNYCEHLRRQMRQIDGRVPLYLHK